MMIWLESEAAGTGAEHGILRADEVQAVLSADAVRRMARERRRSLLDEAAQQARAMADTARAEAEAIVADARDEAGRLLEAAREEAVELKARAHAEGSQHAANEWHALLEQQRRSCAGALRGVEEALAGIAATAVERLVAGQPREALWRQALTQIQTLTRGGATAVMRVAPQDEAEAREAVEALALGAEGEALVSLSVDANLGPGDCIFESEHGVLDASLSLQLQGLRAALGRAVERVVSGRGEAADGGADKAAAEDAELRYEDDVGVDDENFDDPGSAANVYGADAEEGEHETEDEEIFDDAAPFDDEEDHDD